MIKPNTKKALVLILLAVLTVVLVFLLTKNENSDVEYSPRSTNNEAGPIIVKAHSDIDEKSGTYTISPTVKGDLQIIDNYIIFWPLDGEGFAESTSYKVSFNDYKLKNGENIDVPTIKFKVDKKYDYTKLQREVLDKYGRFEEAPNPFLAKLPYTKPYRFRVSYVINEIPGNEDKSSREVVGDSQNWREKKQNYTVLIETLVTQGRNDSLQMYIDDTIAARNEALAWISSQKVDPKSDIIYAFIPTDELLRNPGAPPDIEL